MPDLYEPYAKLDEAVYAFKRQAVQFQPPRKGDDPVRQIAEAEANLMSLVRLIIDQGRAREACDSLAGFHGHPLAYVIKLGE